MSAKTKNIISWVLAGLLAFVFLGAGISKILGVEMQLKNLESWGYPLWMRFPIGLAEIILAIGLLLPKYRRLATLGVFPWALVAIITHLQAGQTNQIGAPLLFALLAAGLYLVLKSSAPKAVFQSQ
jgi:uncharacterized membrane protein YphA (DoxX/SURF4 family)